MNAANNIEKWLPNDSLQDYHAPIQKESTEVWGPWHALAGNFHLAIEELMKKFNIADETIAKGILSEIIDQEHAAYLVEQCEREKMLKSKFTETQKTLAEIYKKTTMPHAEYDNASNDV